MALYNINEAVFELPGPSWDDQTINILGTPAPDGSNFGVVVARFKLQEGQSLAVFVDKHLEEHSQTLRGYELLGRRDSVIAGLPAVEVKLKWLNEGNAIFHRVAFIGYYELVVVLTGSSLVKNAGDCELLMDAILPTLRFRER